MSRRGVNATARTHDVTSQPLSRTVFSRLEYVDEAIRWNPSWEALDVLDMHGSAIMADLDYDEWLGINPWSITEFKLPPRSSYWNV